MGGERRGPEGSATRVELSDLFPHGHILTTVDACVNVSTLVDTFIGASREGW
jgi:hypothetical protein